MIFWITFPNISIFLWISIIPEPSELTRGQTPCEPTRCFYYDEGVAKDYKQAVYWFMKAADQGYEDAKFYLKIIKGE